MDKGKAAMGAAAEAEEEGVDELLAALGYRVRASDMADVAQKLEQLETAMAGCGGADDAALLPFDNVHYNPSDISTWLDSMLSELNAPPPSTATGPPPSSTVDLPTEQRQRYDLEPIPDALEFGSRNKSSSVEMGRERKRMRGSSSPSTSSSSRGGGGVERSTVGATKDVGTVVPVVVVADAQEAGVRLVHALLACAEAVQCNDFESADALLKQISVLAAALGGAMRKVAGYFAEALARRVYRLGRAPADAGALADVLYAHFYESCPNLKFAHFTANQAILEAVAGSRRVHVIDFGIKHGMQWPALMQALALRPGGPPLLRLTGIGPPRPDGADALQQVGWKLARLADTIGVGFEYQGLVANSLADVEPFMLRGAGGDGTEEEEEEEAVAVNAVFELHPLLARAGAVEKVLRTVRAARPRIVTVVEQEADHNVGTFAERFSEALHYYSTVFDSLEGGGAGERAMAEVYVGWEICNVVACEGAERTERHERVDRWRRRMAAAGFAAVHLGSNAFKQASMLLALFAGGEGYGVEERDGCLTLGWHTRPLITTSAWRCIPSAAAAAASR